MSKSVLKLILAMQFCWLDGMVIGSGCTALDCGDTKFGFGMLLGGTVALIVVICYIVTVFKSIYVESRLKHDIEQMINLSHFD